MSANTDLPTRPYRQLARNALLANARLDRACIALGPGEWEAPRISFFPSIMATMVHLLNADRYYIGTLVAGAPGLSAPEGNRLTPNDFSRERAAVDAWFVDFCEDLTEAGSRRLVSIPWPDKTFSETVGTTLLHVFLHGQHHRGQVHSMLSGTSVPPPQIDEFVLAGDDTARADDLIGLGWTEERLGR
jgi:uncharacterized damage-inducible protein DinB